MLEAERDAVAAAARALAAAGLVHGSAGNVSARAGELVAITPTGAQLDGLEGEEVTVVDLAGELVAGERAPSSELAMHLGIYRHYGSGAVVHTHPPVATALACVLEELPVIHYQQLRLGGSVPVVPYATFGSRELAELTVEALAGRSAALMSGHGAVVHGADLDRAVECAGLLEWICSVYWRAAALGTPRVLGAQEQADARVALEHGYGATLAPDAGARAEVQR